MPRPKETNKAEILNAISKHLALKGPTDWPELMAKYPDVSRATFYRYIKEVREGIEKQAVEQGPASLRLAQKRIKASVAPQQTTKQIKARLPASPSPAVIAEIGSVAQPVFNFFAYFNQLVADQEMVRNAAVRKNEDGTETLKNPVMMDRNNSRKLQIIETWLHSQELVWNYEKLQELYRLVIDEVGKADPDVQQNILVRLRELDNKRGITIDARLG
jgi:hypothetical protein